MIRQAGDVLRLRGHCRNELEDEQGRVCLNGAMNIALHGDSMFGNYDTEHPFLEAASVAIGDNCAAVLWNNEPERTPEEVQIALDAAYIVQLQEEGVDVSDTDWEEL